MMLSCIGDVTYGKEQAKKYRDIITAFQVASEDKKAEIISLPEGWLGK